LIPSLSRPLPEPLSAIVTFIAASLGGSDAQESLGPTQAALGNVFEFGEPENFGGRNRPVAQNVFEPISAVAGPQSALTCRHSLLQEAAPRPPGLFRFERRSCGPRRRRFWRTGVCPFALRRLPRKHNRHKTSPGENFLGGYNGHAPVVATPWGIPAALRCSCAPRESRAPNERPTDCPTPRP